MGNENPKKHEVDSKVVLCVKKYQRGSGLDWAQVEMGQNEDMNHRSRPIPCRIAEQWIGKSMNLWRYDWGSPLKPYSYVLDCHQDNNYDPFTDCDIFKFPGLLKAVSLYIEFTGDSCGWECENHEPREFKMRMQVLNSLHGTDPFVL